MGRTMLEHNSYPIRIMLRRIEDIGACKEKLRELMRHEIFDSLSKHDEYWHHQNEDVAEKLDTTRRELRHLEHQLGLILDILEPDLGEE